MRDKLKDVRYFLGVLVALSIASFLALPCYAQMNSTETRARETKFLSTLEAELAKPEPDRPAAVEAIQELGQMRSKRAIPLLIKALDLTASKGDEVQEFAPRTRFDIYPATRALYVIGSPSAEALLQVVAEEEPTTERSLNAQFTLARIFSKKQDRLIRLYRARSARGTPPERERLGKAILAVSQVR